MYIPWYIHVHSNKGHCHRGGERAWRSVRGPVYKHVWMKRSLWRGRWNLSAAPAESLVCSHFFTEIVEEEEGVGVEFLPTPDSTRAAGENRFTWVWDEKGVVRDVEVVEYMRGAVGGLTRMSTQDTPALMIAYEWKKFWRGRWSSFPLPPQSPLSAVTFVLTASISTSAHLPKHAREKSIYLGTKRMLCAVRKTSGGHTCRGAMGGLARVSTQRRGRRPSEKVGRNEIAASTGRKRSKRVGWVHIGLCIR